MRKRTYYLCICGRNDRNDISYVIYTSDWQSKLSKLNYTYNDNFYCVCGYKVNDNLKKPRATFIRYLYKKIPNLVSVENEPNAFYVNQNIISQMLVNFIKYTDAYFSVADNDIESDIDDETLYSISNPKLPTVPSHLSFLIDGKLNEAVAQNITRDITRYLSIDDDGMAEVLYLCSLNDNHRFFKIKVDIDKFRSNLFILIRDTHFKKFIVYFIPAGDVFEDGFFQEEKYKKYEDNTFIRAVDHNEDLLLELLVGNDAINLDNYFVDYFNYYFLNDISEKNMSKFLIERKISNLNKYLDVDMYNPQWIEFNGEYRQVYNYTDFLDVSLDIFYRLYPERIEEFAKNNYKYGNTIILSYIIDDLKGGMRLNNSDIYFETNLSDKTIFAFIISLAKELCFDKSSFHFQVVKRTTSIVI